MGFWRFVAAAVQGRGYVMVGRMERERRGEGEMEDGSVES
jgi:hypothetical protein